MAKIRSDITLFTESSDHYRLLEYGDELCVVLRKGPAAENRQHIGFPFPLYSYKLSGFSHTNVSINIHLRGEPLRRFQRSQLIVALHTIAPVVVYPIYDFLQYRKLCRRLCGQFASLSYFDPYHFIGDSFIGLHFSDAFKNSFGLDLDRIYSDNHRHLDFVAPSSSYQPEILSFKGLAVVADLLDVHWQRTVDTIKNIGRSPGNAAIIVGRNLVVERTAARINIYFYNATDPLLKDRNIQDYMDDCLFPFLETIPVDSRLTRPRSSNILINPFGSHETKTLPVKLVRELIRSIISKSPDANIVIIGGYKYSIPHIGWLARLNACLERQPFSRQVEIKYYETFRDILKEIDDKSIGFAVTADTSIAHFLNRIGLPNATFFNLERCDLGSAQSLASDGPLGFCRYTACQFPVLMHNRYKSLAGAVGQLFEFLRISKKTPQRMRHIATKLRTCLESKDNYQRLLSLFRQASALKKVGWTRLLYDPSKVMSRLTVTPESKLCRAAFRISPLYKLGLYL